MTHTTKTKTETPDRGDDKRTKGYEVKIYPGISEDIENIAYDLAEVCWEKMNNYAKDEMARTADAMIFQSNFCAKYEELLTEDRVEHFGEKLELEDIWAIENASTRAIFRDAYFSTLRFISELHYRDIIEPNN